MESLINHSYLDVLKSVEVVTLAKRISRVVLELDSDWSTQK